MSSAADEGQIQLQIGQPNVHELSLALPISYATGAPPLPYPPPYTHMLDTGDTGTTTDNTGNAIDNHNAADNANELLAADPNVGSMNSAIGLALTSPGLSAAAYRKRTGYRSVAVKLPLGQGDVDATIRIRDPYQHQHTAHVSADGAVFNAHHVDGATEPVGHSISTMPITPGKLRAAAIPFVLPTTPASLAKSPTTIDTRLLEPPPSVPHFTGAPMATDIQDLEPLQASLVPLVPATAKPDDSSTTMTPHSHNKVEALSQPRPVFVPFFPTEVTGTAAGPSNDRPMSGKSDATELVLMIATASKSGDDAGGPPQVQTVAAGDKKELVPANDRQPVMGDVSFEHEPGLQTGIKMAVEVQPGIGAVVPGQPPASPSSLLSSSDAPRSMVAPAPLRALSVSNGIPHVAALAGDAGAASRKLIRDDEEGLDFDWVAQEALAVGLGPRCVSPPT